MLLFGWFGVDQGITLVSRSFFMGGFLGWLVGSSCFEFVVLTGLVHRFSALWSAYKQALGDCPLNCVAPG